MNHYDYYYDKMKRLTGADYNQENVALNTFDYYNSISANLPDDFYCGVNAAAFRSTLEPITDELEENIANRVNVQLSRDALNVLNTLEVEYIDNDVQYQNMTSQEKIDFMNDYIAVIQQARQVVYAYEQYAAEKAGDQEHLDLIAEAEPLEENMVYTKAFLMTVPYDPEVNNCDPNPNATVYGYLQDFPFPTNTTSSTKYDVAVWYEENGNISDLNRNDHVGVKSELDYTYSTTTTNQLSDVDWTVGGVPSASHSYSYDSKGNITQDNDLNSTNDVDFDYISYKDMPQSMTDNNTTVNFRYDGTNSRIHKDVTTGFPYEEFYMEGIVVDGNGDVVSYQTGDGYAHISAGSAVYHYYVTDWLGTNRGVMDATGTIAFATDHYPFGKRMPGRVLISGSDGDRYQFTGHEYDDEMEYGYHGARYYNRELGRYMNVDPIDKYHETSYAYAANNPILFVDINGEDTLHFDHLGNLNYMEGGAEDIVMIDIKMLEVTGDSRLERLGNALGEFQRTGVTDENAHSTAYVDNGTTAYYYRTEKFNVAGFKDYLGTVAGESFNNSNEAEGIGMVILNRMQHVDADMTVEGMDVIDRDQIVARGQTSWNHINQSSLRDIATNSGQARQYQVRIQGALQAIQNYEINDISQGAYFWEGTSHLANRGNTMAGYLNRNVMEVTTVVGATTFMRYNPNHRIFGRNVWP